MALANRGTWLRRILPRLESRQAMELEAMKTLPWVICAAFWWITCFTIGASQKHQSNCREKAINDTLNMTLLVGSDMRGRHATWLDIQTEVRKRLGVK